MTTTASTERPTATPRGRQPKQAGGAELGKDRSAEARRTAAAILEVLAGARTPAEAATALGLSVPRYYQLEAQALKGLLVACEPKPRGRQVSAESTAKALQQDNQRLQREVTRQQALVRAAQRSVGLAPPVARPAASSGKKTRKRRVARALHVAKRLQTDNPPVGTPTTPAPTGSEFRAGRRVILAPGDHTLAQQRWLLRRSSSGGWADAWTTTCRTGVRRAVGRL